ncbi:MAG: cytochrome C oxidase subunit IV family protein [Elusimicrobia bacterium]|nr:cytochrome C oxidase subunit IV family protein [Elusimicrobiota bacterium]
MTEHAKSSSHTGLYLAVGGALFFLTALTVAVSHVHLPHPWNFVAGVGIAVLKASLVASIFMHLKWESRLIYYVLGATVFFAFFLFAGPITDQSWVNWKVVRPADPAAFHAPR